MGGEELPMVTVVLRDGAELRVGTRLEASEAHVVHILHMEVPGMEDPEWVTITSKDLQAMEVPGGARLEVRLVEGRSRGYLGRTRGLQVRRTEMLLLPVRTRTKPRPRPR